MKNFSKELFKNPTKEYKGTPFWAWNGKVEKSVIKEQIDVFSKMGFGGFHIHSRIGLKTPYLSDEFMECVKYANEYGKENDMLTYLYDEDKWPSGYGGGSVTKKEEFKARYLLFSPFFYENGFLDRKRPPKGRLTENGNLSLLAKYDVTLCGGRLVSYKKLNDKEEGENTWYAYEIVGEELPWFNNSCYVDVLNPDAIKCFTEHVHEKYKKEVGEEFGKSIPTIFTDEPQFIKMQQLEDGAKKCEAGFAYTSNMDEEFAKIYGYGFFEKLPELFWENADGSLSTFKYHYYNFISSRFAESYSKTLGDWCDKNNIKLTGHLMQEDTLESQSQCVGDSMRSYPHFGIPGIDVLAGIHQYTAAKQTQSVCHQYAKDGTLSELYGVTNWDFPFWGHKLQGDWQAALGITIRVPHLSWMYMGGEAKRDYPAPIDAHSTWFEKYPLIEDHFARVNTALTCGKPDVKIAVLHPIESYWLLIGSQKQTMQKRTQMNNEFIKLTEWLIFSLLDFDFISEGLMPTQNVYTKDGKLIVGEMEYETVVVPKLLTMRKTTADILEEFEKNGGKIVWLGGVPDYCDGVKSDYAKKLNANPIGFDYDALISALGDVRDIDIKNTMGIRHDSLIYQMRKDEDCKLLFVAHGKEEENIEIGAFQVRAAQNMEFSIKGMFNVELLDTMTGDITKIPAICKENKTIFNLPCYEHDSFLFRLTESKETDECVREIYHDEEIIEEFYLNTLNNYETEEPNTLLLDTASWRLDGGDIQEKEEILKIDDKIRDILKMQKRTDSFPQPWLFVNEEDKKEHIAELIFDIDSKTEKDVYLSFEGDEDVLITFNGKEISWQKGEYFVDRMINKVHLGMLKNGTNTLSLTVPFSKNTNLEWCYLLGDFAVYTKGSHSCICEKPQNVGFGDYSSQGFSFYGGNFVYLCEFETEGGNAEIEIPYFNAPLLEVSVDGGEYIPIFTAPYYAKLDKLSKGKHILKIRSYGSRINQFGQVHNCNKRERYFGPKSWRSEGIRWSPDYNLKPCGIMHTPKVTVYR